MALTDKPFIIILGIIDLVNWIYYTEAIENIANCKNYAHWTDGMYKTLIYFMNNKSFYTNALNTPGQNAFDGYLFKGNLLNLLLE